MVKDNNIQMYSLHNEGKSVAAERFIGTLKTKIYKQMHDFYIKKYVYRSIRRYSKWIRQYIS